MTALTIGLVIVGIYAAFATYCLTVQLKRARRAEASAAEHKKASDKNAAAYLHRNRDYRTLKLSSDELEAQWLMVPQAARDRAVVALEKKRRDDVAKRERALRQVSEARSTARRKSTTTGSSKRRDSHMDAAVGSSTTAAIISATSAAIF